MKKIDEKGFETMLNQNHNLEEALKNYLDLLQKKAYFDAHEVLEEAWHPLRKTDHSLKNLVKGLINGAICFEHIKRNLPNAQQKAQKVIVSFERHKHLCQTDIEHFELFNNVCSTIEQLKIEHLQQIH